MNPVGVLLIAAGITAFYWTVPYLERFGLTLATLGGRIACVIATAVAALVMSGAIMLMPQL